MTFSILGRCPRTGQIGLAVTTSSIAVGARVSFVESGVGGVLTQHRTDPRLGPRGLALLRSGCTAEETLAALIASTPQAGWRQIAVLDHAGRTAAFSGAFTRPEKAEARVLNAVALGNILASVDVPGAMLEAFEADPGGALAERLVAALEAGLAAGGEHKPVRSAHLLVAGEHGFPYVDLRVDLHDSPVAELRRLWAEYAPQAEDFVTRAVDPDRAPAF